MTKPKTKTKPQNLEEELAFTGDLAMREEGKPMRVQLKGDHKLNRHTNQVAQEVIAEQIVIIPTRFKEGHVCTAEEAAALQQQYANRVGVWMREDGQKYMQEAHNQGRPIGDVVLEYAANYHFGSGVRNFRAKLRSFVTNIVTDEFRKKHPDIAVAMLQKLPEFKKRVDAMMSSNKARKLFEETQ